ncbi:hypothetical protein Tco_0466488 [Tanacetum coccineum]
MTTMAEHVIAAGAYYRPLMLEKSMYNSWKSRMKLYIRGKKHGKDLIDLILHGPLQYGMVVENGVTRPRTYEELTDKEKIREECDIQATNIVLQGLPPYVYNLVNHHIVPKEIWDRVKLLMEGTELSLQERECKLYNEFDMFTSEKGETIHTYYLRFRWLINDINTIGMTMQKLQVNTKFVNNLQPEWSKFVSDVKLAKDMYESNFDQLYAYLRQHEVHANEVRMMRERFLDPLALILDSGVVVPLFLPGDDLIASLNKSMEFISTIISSRYPTTNNQLRTSSNPRNQATIQDGRVTMQNMQGRQSQSFMGNGLKSNDTSTWGNRNVGTNAANQTRVILCYNYQGEGHMARQCTQPKRPTNYEWFKEKMLLVQAWESRIVLDKEQLAFLANPGTDNLDDFDSDYDEAPSARAVLMANLSSYDFDVISEVPISDTFQDNYVLDHCVQEMYYSEQPTFVHTSDIQTTSDSNIISYDQYMKENESEVV